MATTEWQQLAEAVDKAMRPALEDAARAAALAACKGDEFTDDPEVLVEAVYEMSQASAGAWAELVEAAGNWLDGDAPYRDVEGGRELVAQTLDTADRLLARLAEQIGAGDAA